MVVPPQYKHNNADLLLRPLSGMNPNLDGRRYRIYAGTPPVLISSKSGSRGYQDVDPALRLDLFDNPKLRDFAESFWRNRAREMWSIHDPDKTVIAFTIMKTGANTVIDFLDNSGIGPYAFLYYDGELTARALQSLNHGRETMANPVLPALALIHRWVWVDGFLPAPSGFTLLREPFRRIISSYYYNLNRGEYSTSLEEFIDHLCSYGFIDWQVSWLCNLEAPFESVINRPHAFNRSHVEAPPTNTRLSQSALELARISLDRRFFFAGVTELFDESVFVASLLMGSRYVGRFTLRNRSAASDGFTVPDHSRRRLEALCEPERVFYDEVRRRFETDFAEEIAFFRDHVGSLRLS
jgi:hypothetical protein